MGWDLTGLRVYGIYQDLFPCGGIVSESRVKYGGEVTHTVELNTPIEVFGAIRDRVIMEHNLIEVNGG